MEDPVEDLMGKLVAMSKLTADPNSILRVISEKEAILPDEPTIKVLKGWAHSQLGEYDKATIAFDQAITLNARSYWAYFRKGQMLKKQEKYPQALECFTKAAKLKPRRPDVWIEKGYIEDELTLVPEAFDSYEKAILLGDKTGRGWFGKSRVLTFLNRLDDALEGVRIAIKLNPNEGEFKELERFILDKLAGY